MILFEKDFELYPNAIIDTKTTNKSFLRMASVYKEMKIKNHAFMLTLINPSLQGIDPFDPGLTQQEMMMIALECRINPFFFFREISRAPALASGGATQFEANRGNMALFWLFFNHVMMFLIQIRQTGKSFSTDTLMNYLMNIRCQNTKINLLTKNDDLRRVNIARIKDIMAELPRYLNQRTRGDANNGEEITVNALSNIYKTHVPQSSPKAALNMGRGLTSPIFHIDEGPFQPNIEISLKAALPAIGAASDAAERVGDPYGVIITTTAGKKDDRDGKYMYGLLMESTLWSEKLFDAKCREELYDMIRRNNRGGKCQVNITLNHRQLGKTDEWLKKKIEQALQDGEDADRDYFNRWTSGSITHPLSISLLERIVSSKRDIAYTEITAPNGYIINWYIEEHEIKDRMARGQFILGMDTSEASGGDDISFYLLDIETLETIATGTYNETNLITFSEWVCSFLVRFYNVLAIIERRSTGATVIDYLLLMLPKYGIDPFTRLFNWAVNDSDEYPERWKEIRQPMGRRPNDLVVRYKRLFGFATSGSGETSRSNLYSTVLQNAAKRGGEKAYDSTLIDQIAGLINRNGRIDHEVGEHDDMVIGWLLVHWLLYNGKNLSYYGIDSKRIMCAVGIKEAETREEAMRRAEQDEIRQRIEEVYQQLSEEEDDYVAQRLEHELRLLDRKIILESGEIYSLDDLIRHVKENRKQRRRTSGYQQPMTPNQYAGALNPYNGVMSDRPMSMQDMINRR